MIKCYEYDKLAVSVFQRPKKGNDCSGDCFFMNETNEYFICAVADGLGSGKDARRASARVIDVIDDYQRQSVHTIMENCNRALRSVYRGSVLTVFKLYFSSGLMEYGSIGNIRSVFVLDEKKEVVPLPAAGYLPGSRLRWRVEKHSFSDSFYFLIYSDGLDMDRYDRQALLDSGSEEALIQQLRKLIEGQDRTDDVTFLLGKYGH